MDNSLFEHGHDTTQSQPEASAASRHPAAGDQADGVNPESSAEAFTSTSAEHGAPDADRGSSSGSASAAADTGESSRDAGLRNPRWGAGPTLYTLDEIRESPSRKFHGVSEKEEKAVHRLGAKFILDAGRKMHL